MACAVSDFSTWLGNMLINLKTDESVFGSYITGILDSDETSDEKNEAIQGILSEICEGDNDITAICNEIVEMWLKLQPKESNPGQSAIDVDLKLSKLLESQSLAKVKHKEYTEEEKKIKEAILAQYSEMTDGEEEDDEDGVNLTETAENGNSGGGGGLQRNINAQVVAQADKDRREQLKVDSMKKKEKDREDREKQKQTKEEKKEKRKTVKGERKR